MKGNMRIKNKGEKWKKSEVWSVSFIQAGSMFVYTSTYENSTL